MTNDLLLFVLPFRVLCWLLLAVVASGAQAPGDYKRAEALIRENRITESITLLTRILATQPRNLEAHNLLGIALTGKGDLNAANTEYGKALRIQPDFVPALKNLAINEVTGKEVASALKHFNAALKLAPQDPVIHAYLGKIAYSRHDYPGAANHLAKTGELLADPSVASPLIESDLQLGEPQKAHEVLLKLDPAQLAYQWQFGLGLELAQHQMFQEAIPFFRGALNRSPASPETAFNLAVCYVETKQFPLAIEILRVMANRGPKTADVSHLLAEAYEGNDQTQEAIDTLREALRAAPEDETGYVNLVALCIKYRAYDLGLQIIDAGLKAHPESDRLIFQRGVIATLRNQNDEAEQDFQLASKLAPESNLNSLALGVNYLQTGNLPKAISSLRERVRVHPEDSALQYFLGEALLRADAKPGEPEFAEAKAALEKSVRLNSKFPSAQVDLGKILLKENHLDEAVQHLEQARALDPNNEAAYLQLVIAYRRQDKPELASAMLATLNKLNEDTEKRDQPSRRLRVVKE